MPLDLSGFQTPENNWAGLNQVTNTVKEERKEDQRIAQEKEGKIAATSKFLTDYLDPKDHLTGTTYDPQIVGGFQNILQQAQQLASKGASTNSILMAIGPSVSKLNQYSVTAKQINENIKNQVQKLKPYAGYNLEAIQSEAQKAAFLGPDGKMKDISSVDPNQDYVSMVAKNNPELITSGKGLDDFVAKTPMSEFLQNDTTAYGGRSRNVKVEAKHPFYMGVQRDDKGNLATDVNGREKGLDVLGSPMVDDNNKPIVNPQTGQPFMALDKNAFNAIMTHNPDVADYIRGQVNKHFKDAGAKELPAEGSPQWDMMARHILGDELKTRDRSTFRVSDIEKESAPAIKVDLGRDPSALDALAKYESAIKLKGDYSIYDPKAGKAVKTNAVEAVGKIFNNDPAFLQGESEDLPDGRSVINVTSSFPGGGLKTGRGADDVYKSIFYDPNKRTLIVESEPKAKDATGKKTRSFEEIPESKAGIFMSRIAGSNGVDPDKVSEILTGQGYKGAKFNNASNPGQSTDRLQEEHAAKITAAVENVEEDKFDALKGLPTKDGVVEKAEERTLTSWLPGRDKYAIYVKGKKDPITFKTKEEMKSYIQGKGTTPAATKAATPPVEDLRKKYNY